METPLPCPFCGGEVAPHELKDVMGGPSRYYLRCYNNDCEINPSTDKPSNSEEEIIQRWNKRKEKQHESYPYLRPNSSQLRTSH